jgi:diguanylate cyclase (GGDEF)-like protein
MGMSMRTRLAAGLLLLAMLLLAQPAPAQRPPLAEPRFDLVSDGGVISDSVVSALGVDRQGFVWIGTAIGLVRFDGYEFRRVSTAAGKSDAASGFVRTLLVGRDGALWIGSDSDGLARLDPQHLSWTEYRPGGPEGLQKGTVRALAEDARGQMWIGTVGGGLQRMDMASRRIERLPADSGLPDERVQSLLSTQDGSLWVGTWSGVARRAKGATRFEKLPSLSALSGRIVSLMHQDARGRLWIGSRDGELWLCDADGATAHRLPRDDLARGGVQALVEMGTDEIWIGTSIGIERRASSDGQLIGVLRYHAAKPWGPAGADVRTMVRDASGVLWIGSYGGGLQRHVPNGDAIWVRRGEGHGEGVLGVVDARSLVQVPSGEIWLGSNDRGLAVLDTDLRLLKGIAPGQGGYRGGRAGAMAYRAQDDTVWVAGDAGVNVFAATGRRFLRSLPVGRGRMRVMRVGSDGTVWAGLEDGLYRWSGAGAFERVRINDGQPLTGDVNALGIASDGRLWVGGEGGLFTRGAAESTLRRVDLGVERQTVLGLLVDRQQRLWVDTEAGLLQLSGWQGDRPRFESVSAKLGRAGATIGANLLEDRAGRIWTHRGVYDPTSGHYEEISAADGVDIGTGWFRAYTGLSDGRLLFGGSRGVLVVDPARFRPWRHDPPVAVTELRINGEEAPLARLRPRLSLKPHERSFTLKFASLDLSLPSRNRHRYRLEGVHTQWVETDVADRAATFGGLAPGRYALQLQGSDRNGRWSPQTLEVEIEVLPAWWQTWWAALLGALLLVAAALGLMQLRTRALLSRQQQLELRVQQRTEELLQAQAALEAAAVTDPLTGLRNRRFVVERLDGDQHLLLRRIEEARRRGQAAPQDADLCFFLLDLDHFKQVNDQFGHAAGDSVLQQMRARLEQVFREADYLVRWGGEEFLVVARGGSRQGAAELAERARRVVGEQAFELPGGRLIERSCSIGFACWPLDPARPRAVGWATVLNLADAALYRAKRQGRNRWVGVLGVGELAERTLHEGLGENGELPDGLQLRQGP